MLCEGDDLQRHHTEYRLIAQNEAVNDLGSDVRNSKGVVWELQAQPAHKAAFDSTSCQQL